MEVTIRRQIGAMLEKARREAGLSQDNLGDMTGYDRSKISRVESGKEPKVTLDFLFNCARCIGSTYLEWQILSTLGGLLSIPALDQNSIDATPMSVISTCITEAKEAHAVLTEAQTMFRNKVRPEHLSQKERAFLDMVALQVLELVPAAFQLAVTFERYYGYQPGRGRDLLEQRLRERGHIKPNEKEKTRAMAG